MLRETLEEVVCTSTITCYLYYKVLCLFVCVYLFVCLFPHPGMLAFCGAGATVCIKSWFTVYQHFTDIFGSITGMSGNTYLVNN